MPVYQIKYIKHLGTTQVSKVVLTNAPQNLIYKKCHIFFSFLRQDFYIFCQCAEALFVVWFSKPFECFQNPETLLVLEWEYLTNHCSNALVPKSLDSMFQGTTKKTIVPFNFPKSRETCFLLKFPELASW